MMRDDIFRIHHHVFMSDESVAEYTFLKSSSVQTVSQCIFENVSMWCDTTFFDSPTAFYEWEECVGFAPYFWKRDHVMRYDIFRIRHHCRRFFWKCDHVMRYHMFFASTTNCKVVWLPLGNARGLQLLDEYRICNTQQGLSAYMFLKLDYSHRPCNLFFKTWICNDSDADNGDDGQSASKLWFWGSANVVFMVPRVKSCRCWVFVGQPISALWLWN